MATLVINTKEIIVGIDFFDRNILEKIYKLYLRGFTIEQIGVIVRLECEDSCFLTERQTHSIIDELNEIYV